MNSRTHNSSLTNIAGRTVTQDISSRILTAEAWGSNLRVVHVELLVQNRTNLDFSNEHYRSSRLCKKQINPNTHFLVEK
jgi:hypothetical protein